MELYIFSTFLPSPPIQPFLVVLIFSEYFTFLLPMYIRSMDVSLRVLFVVIKMDPISSSERVAISVLTLAILTDVRWNLRVVLSEDYVKGWLRKGVRRKQECI